MADEFNNDSLLELYLYESSSLLDTLDGILLGAEADGALTDANVNEIFRIMHTIKGSSNMMGYEGITEVAHKAEDLFSVIRDFGLNTAFFGELFDLMLEVSDFLKAEVGKVQEGGLLEREVAPLAAGLLALTGRVREAPPEAAAPGAGPAGPAAADVSGGYGSGAVPDYAPAPGGRETHVLRINFNEGAKMENIRAFMLVSKLGEKGTVNRTVPSNPETDPDAGSFIAERGFYISYTTPLTREQIEATVKGMLSVESVAFVRRLPDDPGKTGAAQDPPAPKPRPLPIASTSAAKDAKAAKTSPEADTKSYTNITNASPSSSGSVVPSDASLGSAANALAFSTNTNAPRDELLPQGAANVSDAPSTANTASASSASYDSIVSPTENASEFSPHANAANVSSGANAARNEIPARNAVNAAWDEILSQSARRSQAPFPEELLQTLPWLLPGLPGAPAVQPGPDTHSGREEQQQGDAATASASAAGSAGQNIISVELKKLDALLDLVGEITINESIVTGNPDLDGLELANFRKAARQLGKLTNELQDTVMSIRMLPVSSVFQRMRRIVRDMGKNLGKEVNLLLIGEDTEVDKAILDAVSDPVMHLVRNAMDHALETPEERLKAGKDACGHIVLSAENAGSDVIISVSDDGRGLDRNIILKKARKDGLLSKPAYEYSDREIHNLLMTPGFSTRENVSTYSGRGVGLDVVKNNIEKAGGSVIIESKKGLGTNIILKIPLTLAIIPVVKVAVGSEVFSIPVSNIRESFKPGAGRLAEGPSGREMVLLRGRAYPVMRLGERFGVANAVTDVSGGVLVLVESGDSSACLLADSLLGASQVVVKPLPVYLNRFKTSRTGISGCTIMSNGSISLIVNVQELLE